MRGRPTDDLTLKAIEILVDQLKVKEISIVLGLPYRTACHLTQKIKEKRERELKERREREEAARREQEITRAKLQPEWRESEKEPVLYLQRIRKFHS